MRFRPYYCFGGLEEFPYQEGGIGWIQQPKPPLPGPRIMGHEASGTNRENRQRYQEDFKIGQHVAMNLRSPCGVCYYCINKRHISARTSPIIRGKWRNMLFFKEEALFPASENLPLDIASYEPNPSPSMPSTRLI